MHILVSFLTTFLVYSASGFVVFYFGSKPTDRELDRRDALMCALVLGIIMSVTSFLGGYGLWLTFFFVVSMLVKVYDCGVWSSIFMTAGAMFLPFAFIVVLRSWIGG
jgi:hypothetical protein